MFFIIDVPGRAGDPTSSCLQSQISKTGTSIDPVALPRLRARPHSALNQGAASLSLKRSDREEPHSPVNPGITLAIRRRRLADYLQNFQAPGQYGP
jgi:hypothetical protein